MKLSELIQQVKDEKPNGFNNDKLTGFVNEIEADIRQFLKDETKWRPYNYANDGGEALIAPAPFDRLYVSYLKARIDYCNEEYESFANNQAQHQSDYDDFKAYAISNNLVMKVHPKKVSNWF